MRRDHLRLLRVDIRGSPDRVTSSRKRQPRIWSALHRIADVNTQNVRLPYDTVARLLSDHWGAILIRSAAPLGKNDSWQKRFCFNHCVEMVAFRVLQHYPAISRH
jgi:hypothetical protein